MAKTVAIIGTLDTKGEDVAFVRSRIEQRGHRVLLIDTGVLGTPPIDADISREDVAAATGERMTDLVARGDRGEAVAAMARGAAVVVRRLFEGGRIQAVMGLGGGAGTTIGTMAMRGLPIGFPKLVVTTIASRDLEPYIGTSDIIVVPSVVDIAGLNRISRMIYSRAADALCAMMEGADTGAAPSEPGRPLVAATMFGVTTPCVSRARQRLEAAGCEVVVFHANGSGGRAMEQLICDGLVDAALDLTTTEWADELVGGFRTAGPTRLDAAAQKGIPQVVSVGALDMVNFGPPESVPERFAGRRFYRHNPLTTLMRTTPEESAELGRILATKLNAASGPTVLLLPLQGISALDAVGQSFGDPAARGALYDAIRANVKSPRIILREVDAHINDALFADLAAEALLDLMEKHPKLRGEGKAVG